MHLIEFALVSQDAHRSYDPDNFSSSDGDYVVQSEIASASQAPQIGEVKELADELWVIAQVHTYLPVEAGKAEAFHIAICTQDGNIPTYRQDWEPESLPAILEVFAGPEGEATQEEGYESAMPTQLKYLTQVGECCEDSSGWVVQNIQRFEPIKGRPVAGYDLVSICWCIKDTAFIAA